MKLTKIAEELRKAKKQGLELTRYQEDLATCMGSESFGYALFDGGYLRAEDWVEGEDLVELEKAINKVAEFKNLVEELHDEF